MKAVLRSYHSPDIADLEHYTPPDPSTFGFLLQAFIGPDNEDSSESFDIIIVTPRWIEKTQDKEDVVIGRHHLIVFEHDLARIINFIRKFCESCTGSDWNEVGAKVARLGRWEFEDYVERFRA